MKILVSPAAFCILFFLLLSTGTGAGELEILVRNTIEGEKSIRACVLGIVHGEEVGLFPFGKIELENEGKISERSPDGDTVFEIASVTKMFTGLLLAEMGIRKEIDLEEPLFNLLPPGIGLPRFDERKITLRDLATHRSGLPRLSPNFWETADRTPKNPYSLFDRRKIYEDLANWTPQTGPGDRFEYSNYAYALLGNALGERLDLAYSDLLTERILEPLGMDSTKTALDDSLKPRFAIGHDSRGKLCPHWEMSGYAPGGGLLSTGKDMNRFALAALGRFDLLEKLDAEKPLSPERGRQRDRLKAAFESVMRPLAEAQDGQKIGLGWFTRGGDSFWWHNGQTGGYFAFVLIDPVHKISVVILSDGHENAPEAAAMRIYESLSHRR